jgi:5-methylcytosine-specific restriction endonuclease McrA
MRKIGSLLKMKNSDIDWSKVDYGKKSTIYCKINNQDIKCEYKVLTFEETYYKVVISLPFSFESNWRKSCDEKIICNDIELGLTRRYQAIKRRNYKSSKLNKFFRDNMISREELFHAPLDKRIIAKFIDYEKKIEKLNKIKVIDYKDEKILGKSNFDKLLLDGKCEYCGVTIEDINDLSEKEEIHTKRARGYSMEIDQKDPNGLYTDDNCVASCYWCNNAKTDEFSVKEFEEIARGINKVWEKRLGKKIDFPTEVYKTITK